MDAPPQKHANYTSPTSEKLTVPLFLTKKFTSDEHLVQNRPKMAHLWDDVRNYQHSKFQELSKHFETVRRCELLQLYSGVRDLNQSVDSIRQVRTQWRIV